MQQFELSAQPRTDVGKGASRRLRKADKIPGIIYGTDKQATSITLEHNEVSRQLEQEAFYSHILTVKVGDDAEQVVLKDLQRHPFKSRILHIDFLRIDANEKLTMRVPLHFINEGSCIGVKQSAGVISHIMTEIEISCLPKDLPEYVEVDLANVDVGESLHLGDLKLPQGVEIYALMHGGDPAQPVVSVHVHRVTVDEEEAEAAPTGEGADAPEAAKDGED